VTVPATDRRAGPFLGTGVITALPFTFKVFEAADLVVTRADTAGLETVLALTTDYTVSLNPDQDASPGGTVTPVVAPAAGETVTITSGVSYEQTLDLLGGGNFSPRAIEDAFDRTVMQIQQLVEQGERTLQAPVSFTGDPQLPLPQANRALGWNSTADALQNIDLASLVSIAVASTSYTDAFSGNGVTTSFTLSANPGSVHALDVAIGGVSQRAVADFTVSGTTITFTSPPPSGTSNVAVRYSAALPNGAAVDAQDVTLTADYLAATPTSVAAKLGEVVSVKDFGAVGDGTGNDTAAIQAAWDAVKGGNGTLFFPAGTYRCLTGLDLRVSYTSNQHFHQVIGAGAVLDFSATALTTGNLVRFGAAAQANVDENARFVMRGLHIRGPHSTRPDDSTAAATSLVGLSLEYALGADIEDLAVRGCYDGYRATFSFPMNARSISADGCHVGLRITDDMTLGVWVGCQFKEGRFGVVLAPTVNTKSVYGQTFIRPNLEGNRVGMVVDPLNGSGIGVHDINVIDPYCEGIALDGFRFGRALTESNAATKGADRTRLVYNCRVTGGMWADGSAWGVTANHDAVLLHAADTSDAPSGMVIDIPVQTPVAGFSRKSTITARMENLIGSTSVVRETSTVERPFIRFPATQVASSGANDLDDYEEGSWTPVVTFSTPGNLSVAYTTQVGTYTKIGDTVIAHIDVLTSTFTHTTASGSLTVSLPFAAGASNNAVGAGVFAGWTAAGRSPVLQVNNGAATASVRGLASGASPSTFGTTEYPTTSAVRIQSTIIYKV
jgi:hypothetical protein